MSIVEDAAQRPLVVAGSLNVDLIVHVERMPAVGETVMAIGYEEALGGKGANQAVAAARLGAAVEMIARVGSDAFGTQLMQGLRDAGVGVAAVKAVPGTSGIARITHAKDGSNTIVVQSGANAALDISALRQHADVIRSGSMLLLQLESPMESVVFAAQTAHQEGIPVILDPAPALPLSPKLLEYVTWLTPNQTEAGTLLQHDTIGETPSRIADRLLDMGARNVVLKMGECGAFLAGESCSHVFVPAFKVQAIDTTAAGDCFNAAFAWRLVAGDIPEQAVRYACAAAACCVTRPGAQASMPTASEVAEFLQYSESAVGGNV